MCSENKSTNKMSLFDKQSLHQRDWNIKKEQNRYSGDKKKKNSIKGIKIGLACVGNRADQMEDRISDIEDRNLEMMLREEERLEHKKMNKLSENYLTPSVKE